MNSESALTSPWPIGELSQRLLKGDTLQLLTRPKQTSRALDVREIGLEGLVQDTMVARFGQSSVVTRRAISSTLGARSAPFPGNAKPDIVVRHGGKTHILELKSSRIDYSRFDNVFEGAAFKEFLRKAGDAGRVPWEVEQDLIKLSLYPKLSGDVGCCLFLMVDGYEGPGVVDDGLPKPGVVP